MVPDTSILVPRLSPHLGTRLRHFHTAGLIVLRVSCLTLEINEFRCYRYEVKIEESERVKWLPGVQLKLSVPLVQYI